MRCSFVGWFVVHSDGLVSARITGQTPPERGVSALDLFDFHNLPVHRHCEKLSTFKVVTILHVYKLTLKDCGVVGEGYADGVGFRCHGLNYTQQNALG